MEICYLIEILHKVGFEGPGKTQYNVGFVGGKWAAQSGVRSTGQGAVTMEYSEAQAEKQRIFTEYKYNEISEATSKEFISIANTQFNLLEVA